MVKLVTFLILQQSEVKFSFAGPADTQGKLQKNPEGSQEQLLLF